MFPHDLETLARERQAAALEGADRQRLLRAAREGQRRAPGGARPGLLLRCLAGLTTWVDHQREGFFLFLRGLRPRGKNNPSSTVYPLRRTRSPSALEGAHRERLA